MTILPLLATYW